ncbi:hypothetical protein niasHT_010524 [Heterodera trifolii]|uniref:BTB domain-containing protein n=1 Tax=Heterodera trifolii TaxID=157864 RepID=A0ABD2L212_9BILA
MRAIYFFIALSLPVQCPQTTKNREMLYSDGFEYKKKGQSKDGETQFWSCVRSTCNGRVHTPVGLLQPANIVTGHNHPRVEAAHEARVAKEGINYFDATCPFQSISSPDDDLTVEIRDKKVTLSASRLRCFSPVIDRMLSVEMREKQQRSVSLNDLGIDMDQFMDFLLYISPNALSLPILPNPKNVLMLLKLADFFQIDWLKSRCEEHLFNCVEIPLIDRVNLIDKYQLKHLKNFFLNLNVDKLRAFLKENQHFMTAEFLGELTWRIFCKSGLGRSDDNSELDSEEIQQWQKELGCNAVANNTQNRERAYRPELEAEKGFGGTVIGAETAAHRENGTVDQRAGLDKIRSEMIQGLQMEYKSHIQICCLSKARAMVWSPPPLTICCTLRSFDWQLHPMQCLHPEVPCPNYRHY